MTYILLRYLTTLLKQSHTNKPIVNQQLSLRLHGKKELKPYVKENLEI